MEAAALARIPYYQDVTLPLDCNGIGLNFILDTTTIGGLLPSVLRIEQNNNLKVMSVSGAPVFIARPDSYITINGARYDVVAHAGSGSYGATCIVKNGASQYILKEQKYTSHDDVITIIEEAIVNFILNKATRPGSPPFTPTIHNIFLSTRNGALFVYILMELLKVDGYKFLASCKYENRANAIYHLYDQIGYRLGELYKTFGYTHGDLKPANVMFDNNYNLRLIDFGFSRLEQPIPLTLSPFNVAKTESHDLSLLALLIKNGYDGLIGPDQDFIDRIEAGYGCKLASATKGAPIICGVNVINNMGAVYMHTDVTLNPAGTFAAIEAALVPHRPLPPLNSLGLTVPVTPAASLFTTVAQFFGGFTGGARKTKSIHLYRKHGYRRSRRSVRRI
jgi:hypothetical protein